ncbi:MAG: hypothetical protein NC115_09640 [Bacteroidales bacterium]|nr:hypothetical protein [Bacteroidales bacterium]
MTAYFTVWPFSLVSGDTFSVTVETQSLSFTKTVTLSEGKSLAFNEGKASRFTVDFTGIEGIELGEPPVDLSANGTANTYIVTNPSTCYSFNASVKGNGIHRGFYGTELEENLTIEPKSALLFWYNCLQTDAEWKDECPVVIESLELVDGKIRFETPEDFVEGNVIIAAFAEEGVTYDSIEADENGLITNSTMLWSWNIWAVKDYVPEECGISVGGYVMMDRNLGALRNELTDDCPKDFTAPFTIGNYYQWGRKDPFPHHADSRNYYPFYFSLLATTPTYTPIKALQHTITDKANRTLEKQIFSNEGIAINGLNATKIAYKITKGEDDYVASVTRAIRNPHKFITDCDVFPNWLPSQGSDTHTFELWGDPTNGDEDDAVKTIYDPCPAGWRLWTKSTIMEMKKVSETDPPYKVSDYGVYLAGSYFAFNGGYRNAANGTNLFNLGYVVKPQANMPFLGWTATSDCYDYWGMYQKYYNWQLLNDNVTFDLPTETTQNPNSASANGRTVRCVKE